MKTSLFIAAAVAVFGMLGSAHAATLSGMFDVTAVNVLNRNSTQSEATVGNFESALADAQANKTGFTFDTFTYTGEIDFATNAGTSTTIGSWLKTGKNGMVDGLDALFGAKQLSKGSIGNGSATTTFFLFTANFLLGRADFTVRHDDGIAVLAGDTVIGGSKGPNSVKTTFVPGFDGGEVSLLYVATNSDPSILKVDVAPVPLPAAFPLLLAGLSGLGLMRLRRKAA